MFNELGVNFQNSKKKDWAKVISAMNGKNEEYIRKALSVNFEDDVTKNDMRIVISTIDNLLPNITQKIRNRGVQEALGIKNAEERIELLDFPFPYSHENPFPVNLKDVSSVNRSFTNVFSKAVNFLA